MDHAEYFRKQISLTEWLEAMNHSEAEAMRVEDNDKRERLRRLNQLIGLPFDQPHQFKATEVVNRTPEFQKFLKEHGHELCAIRLIPIDPALPKLRMRGKSINEAIAWLPDQHIDPSKYRIDFVPHAEKTNWATIFVVNEHGIMGEVTRAGHNTLTQGTYEDQERPVSFTYDFQGWHLERDEPGALEHLQELTALLRVKDSDVRAKISQELDGQFSHDYLEGYFESTDSDQFGIWFIDYNRILGRLYQTATAAQAASTDKPLVSGQIGSPGQATGRVHVVNDPADATFQPGEILVCRMTTPDYLPLMQRSAAIVTDLGGILSHAAIVARELGKPCLTATRTATTTLKTGQTVTVDADAGVVQLLA